MELEASKYLFDIQDAHPSFPRMRESWPQMRRQTLPDRMGDVATFSNTPSCIIPIQPMGGRLNA